MELGRFIDAEYLPLQSKDLRTSPFAAAIKERHAQWQERLPDSEKEVWDAIQQLDGAEQAELFAHCAAYTLNAQWEPVPNHGNAFMNKRRWADKQVLMPPGTRIAVSSGPTFHDIPFVFEILDQIKAKFPDMVLLHGATDTGGELVAVKWADSRGVTSVPFKPDWDEHKRAAPFNGNDEMLEAMPKGLLVFPGTGIQDNIYDKARKLGIKVMDFRNRGGA